MSKRAEKAAMKAYQDDEIILFVESDDGEIRPITTFDREKNGFILGYEQAEKDLGWISVKDKLPETTDYVFTCVKMNGIPQCVGFHYYKDGKWWEGYGEDTDVEVEYWMPIPKFKEEQK